MEAPSSERMNPKKRITRLFQGRPTDRTPCAPLILNHAAKVLGVKISEYCRDGKLMGEAHVASFKKYNHDFIFIFSTTSTLAEAMGTKLFFPEYDAPWVKVPFIKKPEDIGRIKIIDPEKDGRLPVYLEAVRLCNEKIGDEVLVGCVLAGPFTTASALRGTENFLREIYKNPEFTHKLLEVSMENAIIFVDAIAESGGIPVIVEPVASGSLISPLQFERYALPYLKPIVKRVHHHGHPCILHICGRTQPILHLMADTGADALSLDMIDLEEARYKVGKKVCLIGNVRPVDTMLRGNPEDVKAEAKICIEKARDNPRGFILSSGCEVPIETPPENVLALIDAAKKYGRRH